MSKPENTMSKHQKPVTRRDATGHLDPQYERELLAASRENQGDDGNTSAFITRLVTGDALGEELGEAFVQSATSGEDAETERQDRVISEEQGGPFVPSSAAEEFASGTDASNIAGATREPFPKTSKTDP
jgi:hypothetical protein